jgi:hypothetical protein
MRFMNLLSLVALYSHTLRTPIADCIGHTPSPAPIDVKHQKTPRNNKYRTCKMLQKAGMLVLEAGFV